MARVAWELSVGPPLGVDSVGQMQLRIQNKHWQGSKPISTKLHPIDLVCTGG